jgi:CheY-like chemotaxis protein/phosphoribosyl 1,2-cyclic phosphodiesterase
MATAPKPVDATILLSHTHWDHIQGFPFFIPVFVPGNRFRVCGPKGASTSLPEVMSGQMEYTYFPVELSQLGATIEYHDLAEGVHDVGGVRVATQFLNHPAMAVGYRIEADGVAAMYLCDHEPYWEPVWRSDMAPGSLDAILHEGDRRHATFMAGADVVVHDAQYTPEEYPAKKNWGHSTYSAVVNMAAAAGVKRLFLTHHDPTHSDDFLDEMEGKARELARSLGSSVVVSCAREGYEETFSGTATSAGQAEAAPLPGPLGDAGKRGPIRVLIVDDDEDLRLLARKSLTRAGHIVIEAAGGAEGIEAIEREQPDLALLDLSMPGVDGYEVLRRLRAAGRPRRMAVVVLTAHGDEESARRSFELGATDFLAKPFTPPQLDARVRSCYARLMQASDSR